MMPSSLRVPVTWLGSRSSTVRRSSSSVLPTLEPSASPPFLRAWTGLSSSRLEVSAALRMSASPIVRTLSACAANSGLLGCAFASASM